MERVIFGDVPGLINIPDAKGKPAGKAENRNHRAKAVKLSFLLHALLVGSAVIMHGHAVPVQDHLVIDFTVARAEAIMEKPAEPDRVTPGPERQATAQPASSPIAPVPTGKNKTKGARRDIVDENYHQKTIQGKSSPAAPSQTDNAKKPTSEGLKKAAELTLAMPGSEEQAPAPAAITAAAPPSTGDKASGVQPVAGINDNLTQSKVRADHDDGGTGNQEKKYLRQNFDYIRHLIMRNLSFPAAARKLGWSGKIVVSFIIREDGNVEDIDILSSSGHEVLDINVIAAIRRTAPFPEPPGKAQFILPIAYRLK